MRCEQKLLSDMSFVPFGDLLLEPLRNGLTKPKAVRGDGVKMIGMGEIFANSRIGSISMSRVPVTEKELSNNCIKKGDILFARQSLALEGAGRCSIVIDVTEETVFESHLIRARIDSSKANPYFVYYYFNSYVGKEHIKTIVEQVAAAGIRGSDLIRLNVPCPDIETQNKIAAILSALDEKIAINRAINENLEQQAQAVFMNMFAERKATVPATIADVAFNVTDGVHNTVYDDPEGKFLLLSCKNIKNGTLSIGSTERRISFDTFEKLRRRTKLSKGDVLISSVGTVGELLLLNKDPSNYEFQRSVAMVKPNPAIVSPAYLYESLVFKKAELINAAHGAVQQCLFISDIAGFPIGIPKPDELCDFNTIVTPMFDMISANEAENQRLSELRDTLLPKLMSGDLDVSKLML